MFRNKLGSLNENKSSSGTNCSFWKKSDMTAEKYPINKMNTQKKTIFVNPQILNKFYDKKDKTSTQATPVSQQESTVNICKTENSFQSKLETINEGRARFGSSTSSENKSCGSVKQSSKELNIKKINIFVNPQKFNEHEKIKEETPTFNHPIPQKHIKTNIKSYGKVFINPNFQKSFSDGSRQYNLKVSRSIDNDKIKHSQNDPKQTLTNVQNEVNNERRVHQICSIVSLNEKKHRTRLSKGHPSIHSNNITVFINPDFNLSKKHDSSATSTKTEVLRSSKASGTKLNLNVECTKNDDNAVSHNIIINAPQDRVNNSHTMVILNDMSVKKLMSSNDYVNACKTNEPPSRGIVKKRKSTENPVTFGKKQIFVNPKFKSNLYSSNSVLNDIKTLHDASVELARGINQTVERDKKGTTIEKTRPQSFLNFNIKETTLVGKNLKISNRQAISNGSKLVSLSATKLVRKRKVSHSSRESSKGMVHKNLRYVTKTKLIRYSTPKKVYYNPALDKLNSRQLTLKKSMLPDMTSNKSNTNIYNTSTPSNTTVTTKIRSKNGKTLKLIRKTINSAKKVHETSKFKSINVLQKRKYLMSKHRLCTLPARLSKTKFSKINTPVSRNTSTSNPSKYVYNNKEYSLRQTLTKAAVLTIHKRNDVIRNSRTNNLSDKVKYIKSKYRLVRRLSNVQDRYKRSSMKFKHISSYRELPSSSKMKWKLKKTPSKSLFKRKQFCIVNIGGTFYRCSRTSLIRNRPSKKVIGKQSKCKLLYIHGMKFRLENNGQTLTCLDNKVGRGRIDIGGITFIKSSSGTSLTRTNYHTARSIIRQAKQKSISVHKRNLKKNNEPCLFFHRFGRCSGKERGTCIRKHDPKYVAVCKKFVQGQCSDPNCLLSHTISFHNMPTCQHFLAGNCGRDNCPYLHIKVSNNAPLCLQFLQGYCPLADQCVNRHFLICPAFEKGACSRGKYCPYPHPKSGQDKACLTKFRTIKMKPQPPRDPEPVSTPSLRYFEDVNLQQENKIEVKKEDCCSGVDSIADNEEDRQKHVTNRPKLGRLPSFIPLSTDE